MEFLSELTLEAHQTHTRREIHGIKALGEKDPQNGAETNSTQHCILHLGIIFIWN